MNAEVPFGSRVRRLTATFWRVVRCASGATAEVRSPLQPTLATFVRSSVGVGTADNRDQAQRHFGAPPLPSDVRLPIIDVTDATRASSENCRLGDAPVRRWRGCWSRGDC